MRDQITLIDLENLVKAEIAEIETHFQPGEGFTAWDLTQSLRQKNPNVEVRHSTVRNMVRQEMDNRRGWTGGREQRGNDRPYVYRKAVQPPPPPPAPPAPAPVVPPPAPVQQPEPELTFKLPTTEFPVGMFIPTDAKE